MHLAAAPPASRCSVILPCVMRDDVEQIVDEPCQVRDLPLDDLAHPRDARRRCGAILPSTCAAVTIGASGLRSSCDSIARNSSLRRLASCSFSSADLGARNLALQAAVELRIVERDGGARRDLEQAALVEQRRLRDSARPDGEGADVALADLERQHVCERAATAGQ